jgi:hypothetical protein
VAEIQGSRELGGSRGRSPKVGCPKSRMEKPREDQSRPSEEDRWQRSRDFVKLRGSQGKGPSIGCSKLRDARSEKEG